MCPATDGRRSICQEFLTALNLSGYLDDMTQTQATESMLTVKLTVEDDWESDPLRVVAGVREGMSALDEWQRKAVAAARQQGCSWEEVGKACGVSRQAAWERFAAND